MPRLRRWRSRPVYLQSRLRRRATFRVCLGGSTSPLYRECCRRSLRSSQAPNSRGHPIPAATPDESSFLARRTVTDDRGCHCHPCLARYGAGMSTGTGFNSYLERFETDHPFGRDVSWGAPRVRRRVESRDSELHHGHHRRAIMRFRCRDIPLVAVPVRSGSPRGGPMLVPRV